MNKNWFKFYPVGQGLFYAGILSHINFKFVYDCGSETGGVNLPFYINHLRQMSDDDTLDFVVISHLHADHFSGVKDLLKVFKVNRFYLPYICDDKTIRIAIAACLLSYEEEIVIDDILFILKLYEDNKTEWNNESDDIATTHDCIIDNNGEYYWEFDFVSKRISNSQENSFKTHLNSLLAKYKALDVKTLISMGKLDELRNLYAKVFGGNLNITSLVMLHRPIHEPPTDIIVYEAKNLTAGPIVCKCIQPISLLTGDAEFDKNMTNYIESLVGDKTGIIQVPHHGSYSNWDKLNKNLSRTNTVYLIPCGTKNRYRHPSKKTIAELNGYDYQKVTEIIGYTYWISII